MNAQVPVNQSTSSSMSIAGDSSQTNEVFLTTIKRQRETALDAVASLSAERDLLFKHISHVEQELKVQKQLNMELKAKLKEYQDKLDPKLSANDTSDLIPPPPSAVVA